MISIEFELITGSFNRRFEFYSEVIVVSSRSPGLITGDCILFAVYRKHNKYALSWLLPRLLFQICRSVHISSTCSQSAVRLFSLYINPFLVLFHLLLPPRHANWPFVHGHHLRFHRLYTDSMKQIHGQRTRRNLWISTSKIQSMCSPRFRDRAIGNLFLLVVSVLVESVKTKSLTVWLKIQGTVYQPVHGLWYFVHRQTRWPYTSNQIANHTHSIVHGVEYQHSIPWQFKGQSQIGIIH